MEEKIMELDFKAKNLSFLNLNINSTSDICVYIPPHINSKGFWSGFKTDQQIWLQNSLPLLELQLIMIFSSIAFVQFILKRFGLTKLPCQILTGLMFGCSWKQWDMKKYEIFSVNSETIIGLLAYLGYSLYLFLAAAKMDLTMTIKTRRKALIIAIPVLLAPVISGMIVQSYFVNGLPEDRKSILTLITPFHAMTSFPVIASLLSELRMVSSELGRLGLSSSLLTDLLSLFIMTVSGQSTRYRDDPVSAKVEVAVLIFLMVLIIFLFRPIMVWMVKRTPEGEPVERSFVQIVVLMSFISTVIASFTGQSALLGPYIMGLAVPCGAPLGSTLVDRIEYFVSDGFLPILVMTCSIRVDLSKIFVAASSDDFGFTKANLIIVSVTLIAKFVTCFISSKFCRMVFKDSLILSLTMCCKGVVEIGLYTLVKDSYAMGDQLYGCLLLIILFISTFIPIAVRFLYDSSRKYGGRNIMNLNPNSELRILSCLHRDTNIFAFIHLLNLSCPTLENPLSVFVLHLIELIGRTTPVFISHKSHSKTLRGRNSYSENILLSLHQYESENDGAVSVECFTSITPSKFMQDDICSMALNKITSLIILPFHRTWTLDSLVDQDDTMVRMLNFSVLDKAPCSVAIFADRGHLGRVTSMASADDIGKYSVCVIYLGGADDREAISFAKRMVKDSRVELTVLRIRSSEEDGTDWDEMLGSESMEEFKLNLLGDGNVKYIEEISKDGIQTAITMRKMVKKYDLMIVGRRSGLGSPLTAGLNEWNEFPELGLLGDFFASTEINCRASVLVIQQQGERKTGITNNHIKRSTEV